MKGQIEDSLREKIATALEADVPDLPPREIRLPQVPGKALAVGARFIRRKR